MEDLVIVNVSDLIIIVGLDMIVCEDINEVILEGQELIIGSMICWYFFDLELIFSDEIFVILVVSNL